MHNIAQHLVAKSNHLITWQLTLPQSTCVRDDKSANFEYMWLTSGYSTCQDTAFCKSELVSMNENWIHQHGRKLGNLGKKSEIPYNISQILFEEPKFLYRRSMDFCHAVSSSHKGPSRSQVVTVKPWSCCSRHPMRGCRTAFERPTLEVFVAFIYVMAFWKLEMDTIIYC